MIKINIDVKNSETFNNIWFFLILFIGCVLTVVLVIGANYKKLNTDNKLNNNKPIALRNKDVAYFNDYFKTPLPFGIYNNVSDDINYQVDNAFVTRYLTAYVNQSDESNVKDNNFLLYDRSKLDNIASDYFGYSTVESNFPSEGDNYLIAKKSDNAKYRLASVKNKTDYSLLVYDEVKTAYLNGDPNNDSKEVVIGKYTFKVMKSETKYLAISYRFETVTRVADDYMIVVE